MVRGKEKSGRVEKPRRGEKWLEKRKAESEDQKVNTMAREGKPHQRKSVKLIGKGTADPVKFRKEVKNRYEDLLR